jgi:hypothetical protein
MLYFGLSHQELHCLHMCDFFDMMFFYRAHWNNNGYRIFITYLKEIIVKAFIVFD